MINIRNISIKCGNCKNYQTLAAYERRDEWNIYSYECENDRCDPEVTRTLVEVPHELDEFANRDPKWRGGGKHGELGDGASDTEAEDDASPSSVKDTPGEAGGY